MKIHFDAYKYCFDNPSINFINFHGDNNNYKKRWTDKTFDTASIYIFPGKSPRGLVVVACYRLRQALKKIKLLARMKENIDIFRKKKRR